MTEIPEINFKQPLGQTNGFEFMSIETLYNKLDKVETNHNPFKPHKLNFYIIMYVESGTSRHFVDFTEHSVKEGDLVILNKGQVHSYAEELTISGPMLLFTEQFLLKNLIHSDLSSLSVLYDYPDRNPVFNFDKETLKQVDGIFSGIEEEYMKKNDTLQPEILRSYLKILLLFIQRYHDRYNSEPVNTGEFNVFRDFTTLIRSNKSGDRSVTFYAEELGISVKKLNEISKVFSKTTAKQYITRLIIIEIQRLLVSTDLSTKELCYQFYFDEPTNFVKFFKKNCGMTPEQFRNSN